MPQIPSDPELKAIEAALAGLAPLSSRLNRDKLMFAAGAMSRPGARERRWAWPAITATLTVALAGESLFLAARPAPRVVERIVLVPAPTAARGGASFRCTGCRERTLGILLARVGGRANPSRLARGPSLPTTSGLRKWSRALAWMQFPSLIPSRHVLLAATNRLAQAPARPGRCESGAPENPQSRRSFMSRRCAFVGWLAAAALVSSARANAQEGAVKPTPIVLRPAAAPVPALKYQLLPDHRTPAPGNAAIFYHRAIEMSLEQQSREQRARSRTEAELDPGLGARSALSDSARPAKRLLEASRNALHEVELGARRPTCDWGFEQREQPVELLIGEIQQMRALIRLVSLRARLAVLDGHLDDAVHWIQTGFAMARHTSLGPVLIQSLIGVSMSQVMCIPLEDLIQAPGAPSLYWALRTGIGRLSTFPRASRASAFCWSARYRRCASSTARPGASKKRGNSRPSCNESSPGMQTWPMAPKVRACEAGPTDWAWPP